MHTCISNQYTIILNRPLTYNDKLFNLQLLVLKARYSATLSYNSYGVLYPSLINGVVVVMNSNEVDY